MTKKDLLEFGRIAIIEDEPICEYPKYERGFQIEGKAIEMAGKYHRKEVVES